MSNCLVCLLSLMLVTSGSLCPSVFAGIVITVPSGLNPGDLYRLSFVTLGKRDSLSLSIEDYNAFVTEQAHQNPQLRALNTTWTVIGSTPTVSARQNTLTDPAHGALSIYGLNGDRIARDYIVLWGRNLQSGIMFDQHGDLNLTRVSTGTSDSGYQWFNGELGRSLVSVGNSGSRSSDWIRQGDGNGASLSSFYAVSGYLTVAAVPEPNSFLLLIGAVCARLIGLAGRRIRLNCMAAA